VAVGVGAGELGGDLGAPDRPGEHPQVASQDRDIEAGEMEDLFDPRIA
jgi:hypothetical protein